MAFPFVRQYDAMQCGISCMAMICRFHGKTFSLQWLEKHCGASREGVSLKALEDLGATMGLGCVAGKARVKDLRDCPLPCILHWNQNHFVVLYKIDRDGTRFWIADPAKGRYRLRREEFARRWLSTSSGGAEKGIAMFIETTPEFEALDTPDSGERRSFRFLWGYIVRYRRYFLQILLGLLLGCVLQLVMPFLTQWTVDIGIRHRDIGFIWLVLLGELMIVTGRTATDFIRRWLLLHISMRINISIVSDFLIKLLRLPMSFFETKMLGYYPPLSGSISIAGVDIGAYDLRWWRRQCGVVMQDGVIFSESIARNIAVGDGKIDTERLEEAARTACIHDFVMSLPLRYDTLVGRDGTGLSQGQRQRILIARAVYRDPDFIFLDEATNALDARNERTIVENLGRFYRGRTVVVVAHRLSTVRNADNIVVIENGRIKETGSHAELIARKGAYFNLVRNQLELGT